MCCKHECLHAALKCVVRFGSELHSDYVFGNTAAHWKFSECVDYVQKNEFHSNNQSQWMHSVLRPTNWFSHAHGWHENTVFRLHELYPLFREICPNVGNQIGSARFLLLCSCSFHVLLSCDWILIDDFKIGRYIHNILIKTYGSWFPRSIRICIMQNNKKSHA